MKRVLLSSVVLTLALATAPARAGEVRKGVSVADQFPAALKHYQVKGEIQRVEGCVILLPDTTLRRALPLGYRTTLRAVVRWPADSKRGDIRLRLPAPGFGGALVALRRAEGQVSLSHLTYDPQTTALGKAPAGEDWVIVLDLHFGLARAKAWPRSRPEPKDWHTMRTIGITVWQPEVVEVEAGLSAGGSLVSLATTSAPRLVLSAEQQRQKAEADRLLKEGRKLMDRFELAGAITKASATVELLRKALPADHPDLGRALSSLSGALHTQGKFTDALARCDEGLAIRRKSLPPLHPDLVLSLLPRGRILSELGRAREAETVLREALAIARKVVPADHPAVPSVLEALGRNLVGQGRPAEARRCLEEARNLLRKASWDGRHRLATVTEYLADVLHILGRPAEACALYEESLALLRKALPANHPEFAIALFNYGGLQSDQGKEEGLALQRKAVALLRKALPGDHPRTAGCLNNLGVACLRLRRFEDARGYLEEALAMDRRCLAPSNPLLGFTLNNLGVVARTQGREESARALFEEALAVYERGLPGRDPSRLLALQNLGNLLSALGRHDEAWAVLRKAGPIWGGYVTLTAADSAARDHAALVRKGRFHISSWLKAAGRQAPFPDERALELLASLLDAKAVNGSVLGARLDAVVRAPEPRAAAAWEQLKRLRRQSSELLVRGPGSGDPAEFLALCKRLEKQEDDLERKLAELVNPYAELRRARHAGPAELAAHLPAKAALVEFVCYDADEKAAAGPPQPRAHYAAVVLWKGEKGIPKAGFVSLGAARILDEAIVRWRKCVQTGAVDAAAEKTLRTRLWDPLARVLPKETERLIVAPDGALALLPFEALRLADDSYLIERFQVRYVSSGRDLMPRPVPAGKGGMAVMVADPAYDAGPPGKAGAALGDWRFKALPGFARELDAVAKLLRGRPGWEVRVLRGEGASEEAVASLKRPRVLYCITHGFFAADRDDAPAAVVALRDLELAGPPPVPLRRFADPRLRSGLALAGANRGKARAQKGLSDGLLTALEVEDLDLWGTELVVLSACETGLGVVQADGEGTLGLRRAFQLAGARTVLASLWKVPDTQTEQLMVSFFGHWLEGAAPADALREAQLRLIRALRASPVAARRQAPPLYWAAFICHGGD
jgi:CHAT domain-containing protein/Flp pilus assembly protein TadD